ncbi:MAG: EamA family transporter [Spirochaetales bacterium]|nr:EamA family transporter [Spirochaetales bacterium]
MNQKIKGNILIIISACAFGSIAVISRIAITQGGDETSIMIIRFAIVSLFFTGYLRLRGISWRVNRKQLAGLLFLGFICYGNVALMMFLAMKYISPALGSLILYTYPAMVMAGSVLFLGESFSRRKLASLIISLTGCAVVLWGPLGHLDLRGVLLAFLVAVFYSIYIIGSRKMLSDIPPAKVSAWMAVCCLVYFTIYGAFTGSLDISFSTANLISAAVLAVWCTIIGFVAFLSGLKVVGAQNAAVISTIEPLYTILLAWLVIGDKLSGKQVIGGLIIMSGVLILNLPVKIRAK